MFYYRKGRQRTGRRAKAPRVWSGDKLDLLGRRETAKDCNGLAGLSEASALVGLADTRRVGADRKGSAEPDRNTAEASAKTVGTQRPRARRTEHRQDFGQSDGDTCPSGDMDQALQTLRRMWWGRKAFGWSDPNVAETSVKAAGKQSLRAKWTIKASGSGATHDARTASEHLAP